MYYEDLSDNIQDQFMPVLSSSLVRRQLYSNLATQFHVNLRNNLNIETENIYDTENNRFDDIINANLTNLINGVYNIATTIHPFNLYDDILERVMQESLDTHTQLVRTDEFINFEKVKYCNIEKKDEYDNSCSICLTEFEDDSDIGFTNCEHIFHTGCITEWSRYKKDCPVCRKDLKK